MTKEIIIGGVNIATLKAQRDAMQQEANKFVAESIASAQALVKELLDLEGDEESTATIDALAVEANELLENARLVSGVTGVTYYLDFYEEYGDSDDVLTLQLENSEIQFCQYGKNVDAVGRLANTLESMESQSRDWHSSTC